ncbi:MAG: PAS domain-containing protein, partial [Alphaproteobacteria bacterium]|nr:PAS domain-containing protein [Alphaproteobacteria bacterium]
RPAWFENAKLRKFYDYWRSKVRDGRLPARADIDPVDIHDLLPSIILIDVVTQGDRRRFRFRLFGTEHVEFNQRDLTGMFIDEVFGAEDADKTADAYARVIDDREPHYWRTNVMLPGREFVHYERLMLPLASDRETVDMLIGVFEFDRIEPAKDG